MAWDDFVAAVLALSACLPAGEKPTLLALYESMSPRVRESSLVQIERLLQQLVLHKIDPLAWTLPRPDFRGWQATKLTVRQPGAVPREDNSRRDGQREDSRRKWHAVCSGFLQV